MDLAAIIATIVLLGVLILVHELGHFWAAKAVGIRVERFSVGLGPRVWGIERDGTEYVLAAIPLGGYVKMQGMDDEVMEQIEGGSSGRPRRPRAGDFDGKPIWARAFVISAGVIMNMAFAFLLFTLVHAAWGRAEQATTRVAAVEESDLPAGAEALARIAAGSEIVRVGETPTGSWEALQRALLEAPPGPLAIETGSPSERVEIAVTEDRRERVALVNALAPWAEAVIGRVDPGSPAADALLESGDRIVGVAGAPVADWQAMVREVGARPGERVEIAVLRNDTRLVRAVVLETTGSGEEARGRLGVYQAPFPEVRIRLPPGQAVVAGWNETVGITLAILNFLGDLFTGDQSPRQVGSIGTIAVESGRAVQSGIDGFLRFMAMFSVNLAILNMLPIPVLDGGHMVFLGIELVRGERLSAKQRLRWSQVGLWVVLGIMVWALGNDLLRFLGL